MIEIVLILMLTVVLTVCMAAKKDDKPKRAKPKPTLPLGLLIPGFVGTAAMLKDAWNNIRDKKYGQALDGVINKCIGWNKAKQKFVAGEAIFSIGWVVGAVIHKGVGGYLGVNRALGAAHVPIFRL